MGEEVKREKEGGGGAGWARGVKVDFRFTFSVCFSSCGKHDLGLPKNAVAESQTNALTKRINNAMKKVSQSFVYRADYSYFCRAIKSTTRHRGVLTPTKKDYTF